VYSTFVFYITYYKFTFQTNLGGTVKKKRWVWPRPWCLCQRLYEGEVRRLQYHRRWLLQSALWSQPTEAIKRKRQSWGRYMLVFVNWTFKKSATSFPKRADVSQNSRCIKKIDEPRSWRWRWHLLGEGCLRCWDYRCAECTWSTRLHPATKASRMKVNNNAYIFASKHVKYYRKTSSRL